MEHYLNFRFGETRTAKLPFINLLKPHAERRQRSTEYAKIDHQLALATQTGVGLFEVKGARTEYNVVEGALHLGSIPDQAGDHGGRLREKRWPI